MLMSFKLLEKVFFFFNVMRQLTTKINNQKSHLNEVGRQRRENSHARRLQEEETYLASPVGSGTTL